ADFIVQVLTQRLPTLPPETHLVLPPKSSGGYRVLSPGAVAASRAVGMVPAQHGEADVAPVPNQVNEFRRGPVGVQSGEAFHIGRSFVSHQVLALVLSVESKDPLEKRVIRGWFPGSEQSLEVFPAEFELPEPLVSDQIRDLLGRDAPFRCEPFLLMPE